MSHFYSKEDVYTMLRHGLQHNAVYYNRMQAEHSLDKDIIYTIQESRRFEITDIIINEIPPRWLYSPFKKIGPRFLSEEYGIIINMMEDLNLTFMFGEIGGCLPSGKQSLVIAFNRYNIKMDLLKAEIIKEKLEAGSHNIHHYELALGAY